MDPNAHNHTKLIWTVGILLVLILIIGIIWFFFGRTKEAPAPEPIDTSGSSPFERPSAYQPSPTFTGSSSVYTNRPVTEPVTEQQQPEPEPVIVNTTPMQTWISNTYNNSFVLPQSSQPAQSSTYVSEPVVYEQAPITYTPTVATSTVATSTFLCSKCTAAQGQSISSSFGELDREIYGYISGLGWTQLFGEVGQQVYDFMYSIGSPSGHVNATLGSLLFGGSGGGGFGGGFGGVGGGAMLNFGSLSVTNIKECTCNASRLVSMNDVRGPSLSLLVTPGSVVYLNAGGAGGMYAIHPGMIVKGNYVSGGACMVYHGEDCTAEGNPNGTITQIGTSI